jgi:GH15 family glucan-1,4-alpha-glucosidase
LALETDTPIELHGGDVRASFELGTGQSATFILEHVPDDYQQHGHSAEETRELFEATVAHWRRWLSQSRYRGRWRETVHRSALTLKLLTYRPTGAIVAAPTTSLPETPGGERNWDYRYTWIRDAAFSLYALLRLGFTEEAAAFMDWLTDRVADERVQACGPLQIMYGIDGRRELPEQRLDHLEGYRGSAPVRVGNDAATQLQLDIYGELVDSIYLYNKHGAAISHDAWEDLAESSSGYAKTGTRRTKGSGKPAVGGIASPTRGCSAGLRSSAPCGSRPLAACRATALAGSRRATGSTDRSSRAVGRRAGARSCSTTTRTCSTRRCF